MTEFPMITFLLPSKNEPNVNAVMHEIDLLFPDSEVVVCNDRYEAGKGWAVRQAMLHARGDIICLLDADFDIHPRMVKRLIPFLEDYDIVLGKKQVRKLWSRRIMTHATKLWTRLLFGLSFDTQTGLKLFKKNVIPYWEANSYAFDIEIISRCHKAGVPIINVPVEVTEMGKSAVPMKFRNIWRAFVESLKIWVLVRF